MSSTAKKARNVAALSGGALVAASPFIATGTAAAGATFTVDSLLDTHVDGKTTLREAIELADADTSTADTITFQTGLTGTITLDGAALYVNSPVTIQGPGASALTITADDDNVPVFYLYVDGQQADISISGFTVTGSNGHDYGAIAAFGEDVTLTNMVITGNTGNYAGGVYFDGSYDGDHGTITISSSDISGNTGTRYTGGVYVAGGGSALYASLVLIDSTVSGNNGGANGGGLYFEGAVVGDIAIINSTISGNTALRGGGIYIEDGVGDPDLEIMNSTITGNTATDGNGGGLYLGAEGDTTIVNSVIWGNTATSDGDDIYSNLGAPLTADYSLIGGVVGVTPGGAHNLSGDPMLGALAANGGLGKTHVPQAGSPLIDAGDPGFGVSGMTASYPSTDQRGGTRVVNSRIDIGAVEVQPAVLPPTGGSNGLMAGLGAALLGLGGALHLTGRRKRTA